MECQDMDVSTIPNQSHDCADSAMASFFQGKSNLVEVVSEFALAQPLQENYSARPELHDMTCPLVEKSNLSHHAVQEDLSLHECQATQTFPSTAKAPLKAKDSQTGMALKPFEEPSRADALMPALAHLDPAEEKPLQVLQASSVTLDACQLTKDFSEEAIGPPGLVCPLERVVLPSPGHSPSSDSSQHITFSNVLEKRLQTLQTSKINNLPSDEATCKPIQLKSSESCRDNHNIKSSKKNSSQNLSKPIESTPGGSTAQKPLHIQSIMPLLTPEEAIHFSNTVERVPAVKQLEANKKSTNTYAKALAPPTVHPTGLGTSPECGILIERQQGHSLDAYAWAITHVIGKESISFIGRHPNDDSYILAFLKNSNLADLAVNEGIWIKNKWFNVSYYQQPAVRLTVSGVLPFIPDTLLVEALLPYGKSVYPVLRKIPAAVRHTAFRGTYSYRREIYLVKNDDSIVIPEKIQFTCLGITHEVQLSRDGPRCFTCGSAKHLVNKCPVENPDSAVAHGSLMQAKSDLVQQNMPNNNDSKVAPSTPLSTCHDSSVALGAVRSDVTAGKPLQPTSLQSKSRDFFIQCNLSDLPALKLSNISKQTKKKKKTTSSDGIFLPNSVSSDPTEQQQCSNSQSSPMEIEQQVDPINQIPNPLGVKGLMEVSKLSSVPHLNAPRNKKAKKADFGFEPSKNVPSQAPNKNISISNGSHSISPASSCSSLSSKSSNINVSLSIKKKIT